MTVLRYAAVFLSVIITLFASVIWALMLPASLSAAIALTCIGILGLSIRCAIKARTGCFRAKLPNTANTT